MPNYWKGRGTEFSDSSDQTKKLSMFGRRTILSFFHRPLVSLLLTACKCDPLQSIKRHSRVHRVLPHPFALDSTRSALASSSQDLFRTRPAKEALLRHRLSQFFILLSSFAIIQCATVSFPKHATCKSSQQSLARQSSSRSRHCHSITTF
jgi:hypothetical protein